MGKSIRGTIDRILQRQALRRWVRTAEGIEALEPAALREVRSAARATKRQLDRVLHVAEGRLALASASSGVTRKPVTADWAWRPDPWQGPLPVPGWVGVETRTEICSGIALFHDGTVNELTVRQIRNQSLADLAPFGLQLDMFRFDGGFLSLAIDLPAESTEELRLKHLVRLDLRVETERPMEIFARLNVKHGPNVEQVVRELTPDGGEATVEFDLAYTRMSERRVERMWVDLIFEGPEMNQITLRDVTFCRLPRAEL